MPLIGAIAGDILGSRYEFASFCGRAEDLVIFPPGAFPTDDTVLTCAVAKALLDARSSDGTIDHEHFQHVIAPALRKVAGDHGSAGYGARFMRWMLSENAPSPMSFGNGAAMRISPCAWAARTPGEALELARIATLPTHGHPEGLMGAAATVWAIDAFRAHQPEEDIRSEWGKRFSALGPLPELSRLTPPIRTDLSCRGTVPLAVQIALQSRSYEETIRRAVVLGGDCGTIAAIAGSIAAGRSPAPQMIREKALRLLPEDLRRIVLDFAQAFPLRHLR